MDDLTKILEGSRVSFIPCVTWVPKGVAKANPDKVELSKEDLTKIILETKDKVNDLEVVEEADCEEIENEESGTDSKGKENATTVPRKKESEMADDGIDCVSRYKLSNYDEEKEDDKLEQLLQLGFLTMHSSAEDDPNITVKDDADSDSETENHEVLPSDNLIAVGHVEGDAAVLEIYVYNGVQGSLYVHHDILLPSVPLCMEWLNYDPGDEELKPGNLLAIGSMSPIVEVWDLDLIDCLQPAYTLGKAGKKKKKIPGVGHKDPVLSLSWNKYAEHILASGSVDQTVILWDLEHGTVAQQIKSFEEKVQAINWHHKESHTLLTGACDGKVRVFDCRTDDTFKTWNLDGEIECAIWQTTEDSYCCLASTDQGTVFAIDTRQEKPLWTLKAHTDACTAIRMSPTCPGCLVTVSSDHSIKVWDILGGKPSFIEENLPRLGTIQCLGSCPDAPFLFCMGGDNKENNFKVWDIRQSSNVRSRFCSRVGLPSDEESDHEDEENEMELEGRSGVQGSSSSSAQQMNETAGSAAQGLASTSLTNPARAQAVACGTNPRPKFRKKKGGHLDNRRKKW